MHQSDKRARTRARLIEAALNVFAFLGYQHATVDDIAEAAGLSKGAFYFNFSAKEDALLALIDMWHEGRTAVLRASSEAERGADDRLREMLAALFSYADGPNWPPLLLEFWALGLRSEPVARRLRRTYRALAGVLAQAIVSCGAREVAARDAALAMLAAHDGFVAEAASGWPGSRVPSPAAFAQLIGRIVVTTDEAPATHERAAAARA